MVHIGGGMQIRAVMKTRLDQMQSRTLGSAGVGAAHPPAHYMQSRNSQRFPFRTVRDKKPTSIAKDKQAWRAGSILRESTDLGDHVLVLKLTLRGTE